MSPHWHDGPLAALERGREPVVWSVALGSDAAARALATTPATPDDLADAAVVRDGAGRLLRRRLARALIARMADVPVAGVRVSRTPHGAPVVDVPSGWHLGLSGRDGDCLIGVARHPIAVDHEPVDEAPPLRDMLTPDERLANDGLPTAARSQDWLRRWTIKEAHAKLIGEPLRIAPETIETRIARGTVATATFEGISHCWLRETGTAIETVAMWR